MHPIQQSDEQLGLHLAYASQPNLLTKQSPLVIKDEGKRSPEFSRHVMAQQSSEALIVHKPTAITNNDNVVPRYETFGSASRNR